MDHSVTDSDWTVYCPHCREELERDDDGELPFLCENCTKPTGHGHLRVCPKCNTERRQLKSGKLANVCRKCHHNYLTGNQALMQPVSYVSSKCFVNNIIC